MSTVLEVDPDRPDALEPGLAAAAEALRAGELVVLPTETVYGIASRPDLPAATGALFEAKRRPSGLSLPVLAGWEETAWEVGVPGDAARRLARAFWPGPLTMVLTRTERSRPWSLGDQGDTVGVRVPDHRLIRSLTERVGPIAATSANRSGDPPLADPGALVAEFEGSVSVFLIVAPGASSPAGRPSTVVDLAGPSPRLLRPGPIEEDRLMAIARGEAGAGGRVD